MHTTDELSLIQQIQAGKPTAFRQFLRNYEKQVFALALDLTGNRLDAEDLSQEVFVKAFQHIHKFRQQASVYTWLYRITLNSYLDQKRKKSLMFFKKAPDREDPDDPPLELVDESLDGDPERQANSALLQQHLNQALQKLSPKERSVIVLKHYHDYSIKDIAENLALAEGTVKSLIFRGLKKSQKALAIDQNEFGTLPDFSG